MKVISYGDSIEFSVRMKWEVKRILNVQMMNRGASCIIKNVDVEN